MSPAPTPLAIHKVHALSPSTRRRVEAGRNLATRDRLTESAVNLEALNRYVLGAIGLFGAVLYIGMVYAGLSELVSRLSKPKKSRKRGRATARARLRNAKKST